MRVTNCTEFEQLLNESVELRQPVEGSVVRGHIQGCTPCRQRWQQFSLLERSIPQWQSCLPDVDLADAVLAQLAFNRSTEIDDLSPEDAAASPARERAAAMPNLHSRNDRPVRLRVASPVRQNSTVSGRSMVAVLAVVATVLLLISQPFESGTRERIAIVRSTPTEPIEPTASESATDVEAIVRGAGSAYLVLAYRTADVFSDAVALIPEQTLLKPAGTPNLNSPADKVNLEFPFGGQLQPIGRDVGHAFDFLLEAISTETEPAT